MNDQPGRTDTIEQAHPVDGSAATVSASPPPARRRRRRWITVIAVMAVVALIGWLAVRDTTPVGHFTSGAGRDRFAAAYGRAMAEMPAPDATLDLRTTYGVVRLYRFDGPNRQQAPLILLPGRASAAPVWADNVPSLRKLRTVYAVDRLGEPGASIQDRPIDDQQDQANWLRQVIEQLPEPQVHLVGLSFGGWTATNVAIRHPGKIAGVVLIDPAVTFAGLPFETIVRSIPASVRWLPKQWRDSFNSYTAGGAPVEDSPGAELVELGMRDYAMQLPAPEQFGAARLQSMAMPVLVIIAGESVIHDAAEARKNAEANLRRGTVLTYEGASHAVNGEEPDRIAADVATFLTDAP